MSKDYHEKLDLILKKLEEMDKRLARVESSCTGMDSHIDFVEGVYTTVRHPLEFMSQKVSQLAGQGTQLALPER